MNSLRNQVTLIGRAGMQPEIKNFDENRKMAKLSIAINESKKKAPGEWVDNTSWYNLVAWGAKASYFEKNVQKGQELMVMGKIVNRSYESNGLKKYITEIEVMDVLIIGKKSNS
jgi:single-strand DNA-binding protein